jgi:hypothetical protein
MGFKLTALVVTGTDCTGSCKTNYHTISPLFWNCFDSVGGSFCFLGLFWQCGWQFFGTVLTVWVAVFWNCFDSVGGNSPFFRTVLTVWVAVLVFHCIILFHHILSSYCKQVHKSKSTCITVCFFYIRFFRSEINIKLINV